LQDSTPAKEKATTITTACPCLSTKSIIHTDEDNFDDFDIGNSTLNPTKEEFTHSKESNHACHSGEDSKAVSNVKVKPDENFFHALYRDDKEWVCNLRMCFILLIEL
jgi:hypothetical protein